MGGRARAGAARAGRGHGPMKSMHWYAAVLGWVLCWSAPATLAHTLSVAHLDAALGDDGTVALEVDLALRDLALGHALDANGDERVTWGELQAVRAEVEAGIADGIRLDGGGTACDLRASGLGVRHYDDGPYAAFLLSARCPPGTRVVLHYGLFPEDRGHRALVTVHDGTGTASAIARRGGEPVSLGASSVPTFRHFFREGVHHILIGYDHLAFLLSLLLPAALLRVHGEWSPRTSLRDSLAHAAGIVTAFTVAHSITLSLAALGWVRPASQWVEAAIALSVLLAALNNLRPVVVRRLWLLGFGFGLIHGFGFAGALGELGLPRTERLRALLGFNLGVEAGQLAIACALLPVLHACRRAAWYRRFALPLLSAAIALLAAWWLWQRVAGT